jgi:hypothetical protein
MSPSLSTRRIVIAACVVASLALAGCGGAKTAEADDTANTLVELVNSGDCSDTTGVPETAAKKWPALCADIRSRLEAGSPLPNAVTTSRDSGEIGKVYDGQVVFRNKFGVDETLTFFFSGTGVAANKPKLVSALSVVRLAREAKRPFTYETQERAMSAEAQVLVTRIDKILNDGNCDELSSVIDPGLSTGVAAGFVADCRSLVSATGSAAIELGNNVPAYFTYTDGDLYGAPADAVINGVARTAGEELAAYASRVRAETADSHMLLAFASSDLAITLMLSEGQWYLNSLGFSRTSFLYTFP